jgi:N-acetylmuramoyl-L-alanine amidase
MSCPRDIKHAVLRGVYEDNVGIPRSSAGKRRSHQVDAPESRKGEHHLARHARLLLMAIVGVAALVTGDIRFPAMGNVASNHHPVETGPESVRKEARDPLSPASSRLAPIVPRTLTDDGPMWNEVGPRSGMLANLGEELPLALGTSASAAVQPITDSGRGALPGVAADTPRKAVDDVPGFGPRASGESTTPAVSEYSALLGLIDMPMADLFGLNVHTIVIDPGHGGIDPGATGPTGLKEKEVTLDIARRLRAKLSRSGRYRVLLTRDTDEKMFLRERVAFAKEHSADLFISIHANSLPDQSVNFVETYYFGPHADKNTLALSEQENQGSDYTMAEFREIIAKIGNTLKTEESKDLATSIHQHLYRDMKQRNHQLINAGVKTGPFVVLLGVEIPSVLVEVSCISNAAEETRLGTPDYRDSVAGFLEKGIVDYLDRRAYKSAMAGRKTQDVVSQER